ncbi:MAG: hypothetical protein ABII27_09495 [bacterium]
MKKYLNFRKGFGFIEIAFVLVIFSVLFLSIYKLMYTSNKSVLESRKEIRINHFAQEIIDQEMNKPLLEVTSRTIDGKGEFFGYTADLTVSNIDERGKRLLNVVVKYKQGTEEKSKEYNIQLIRKSNTSYGIVQGYVLEHGSNQGIEKVYVEAMSEYGVINSGFTDASGFYELKYLMVLNNLEIIASKLGSVPGKYNPVDANFKPGYYNNFSTSTYFGQSRNNTFVDVKENDIVLAAPMFLWPLSAIEGTCRDYWDKKLSGKNKEAPAPGIKVLCYTPYGNVLGDQYFYCLTDSSGVYQFANVRPGTRIIKILYGIGTDPRKIIASPDVDSPYYDPNFVNGYTDAKKVLEIKDVPENATKSVDEIFYAQRCGWIYGYIKALNADRSVWGPVADADITISNVYFRYPNDKLKQDFYHKSHITNEEGYFEIRNIINDSYLHTNWMWLFKDNGESSYESFGYNDPRDPVKMKESYKEPLKFMSINPLWGSAYTMYYPGRGHNLGTLYTMSHELMTKFKAIMVKPDGGKIENVILIISPANPYPSMWFYPNDPQYVSNCGLYGLSDKNGKINLDMLPTIYKQGDTQNKTSLRYTVALENCPDSSGTFEIDVKDASNKLPIADVPCSISHFNYYIDNDGKVQWKQSTVISDYTTALGTVILKFENVKLGVFAQEDRIIQPGVYDLGDIDLYNHPNLENSVSLSVWKSGYNARTAEGFKMRFDPADPPVISTTVYLSLTTGSNVFHVKVQLLDGNNQNLNISGLKIGVVCGNRGTSGNSDETGNVFMPNIILESIGSTATVSYDPDEGGNASHPNKFKKIETFIFNVQNNETYNAQLVLIPATSGM